MVGQRLVEIRIEHPGNMDEAEALVDFLVEDLELLIVHASFDPAHADKVQVMISLCEDLKFISSFLKKVESFPGTSLSMDSRRLGHLVKVKESIRKEIVGIFRDGKICAAKEIPDVGIDACNGEDLSERSRGIAAAAAFGEEGIAIGFYEAERALLERLIGGQKQLEVISISGISWNPGILVNKLFQNPLVLDHFQILEKGSLWFSLTFTVPTIPNRQNPKAFFKNFCQTAKGNRYLVLMDKSEYKKVRTFLPDDCNGSKVLMIDRFSEREVKEDYIVQRASKVISELFECLDLLSLAEKVDFTKKNILKVSDNGFSAMDPEIKDISDQYLQRKSSSPIAGEDLIVGIHDEAMVLLDRLIGGTTQLEIISIVGMAGIGKTTLAKKIYNDPSIVYHFHVCGWASVSQTYQKRNVLHNILCYLVPDKVSLGDLSDQAMGEMLYRRLKLKKYLIVIDDIWDSRAWSDLKMYFPDDDNGSKILMTSRIRDVASNLGGDITTHRLRFLTKDESWELFEGKVFAGRNCPQELREIGSEIVTKCKGLPLAIVVVAGIILKSNNTYQCWRHVAENIGSCIDSDAEQFMDILTMSYDSLPHSLKSCFVYLGAFPEDYEISFRRLIRSWIAEGFIQHIEGKSLEHVAEDCLKNLIDRSLVIVSKKRSDGGIKTCYVHDMLRTLCIRKAKENRFLLPNLGYESYASYSPIRPFFINYFDSHDAFSLTCYESNCEDLHSFYFHYVPARWVFAKQFMAFKCNPLRVLDLRCIIVDFFPTKILLLVRLKYLALWIEEMKSLPSAICNLWNLETLILNIDKVRRVTLPHHVWKMVKLRHLHISPEIEFQWPCSSSAGASLEKELEQHLTYSSRSSVLEQPCANDTSATSLDNLQTISRLCPSGSIEDVLKRIPNVTKLGFHFTLSDSGDPFFFPDLAGLQALETLKFEYQTFGMVTISLPHPDKFPPSLKKLTLIGSHVSWEEMAVIGMLPCLEVLKVKDNFFSGPKWKTCEGGFCSLKFLKFSHIDLHEWMASADDFPSLEQLVLNGCLYLAEIPSALGDICTLQVIEVYRASNSLVDSARQIQESQRSWGNNDFKVFIHHHFQDNI